MIALPAIDLREGACVQLVGGSYADERMRIGDAPGVARRWSALGFRCMHVVDLDAATERGDNRALLAALLAESAPAAQVGGGVRCAADVARLLEAGADRVVVGTRGVVDRGWLEEVADAFPGRVILAADVRGRRVVVSGWTRSLPVDPVAFSAGLRGIRLGGLLVTAVHCEGRQRGTDLALMAAMANATDLPVQAAGGIASVGELRVLAQAGCAGAVLGMALYTGTLNPRDVAEEFGSCPW